MHYIRGARALVASPRVRAAVLLSGGTAFGQVVAVMMSPLISRIYAPVDVGSLAIFTSLTVVGASVAAGRYDGAVVLPEETPEGERVAVRLVEIGILVAAGTTGLAMVGLVALRMRVDIYSSLGAWIYLVPLAVFGTSVVLTLSALAVRQRRFSELARIAPARNLVVSGTQIALGLAWHGMGGLIIGFLLTPLIGFATLWKMYWSTHVIGRPDSGGWIAVGHIARLYSDFPRWAIWATLANALSWNIQPTLIAGLFGPSAVGQYALALTVVGAPMGLVTVGVSQVYQREAAGLVGDPELALRLAKRTVRALAYMAVPLFAAILLGCHLLFVPIFGSQWELASEIAVSLVPLFMARFVAVPVSSTLTVYRRQAGLTVWQLGVLTVTVGCFLMGGRIGWSLTELVLYMGVCLAPLYLALIPWSYSSILRQCQPV